MNASFKIASTVAFLMLGFVGIQFAISVIRGDAVPPFMQAQDALLVPIGLAGLTFSVLASIEHNQEWRRWEAEKDGRIGATEIRR